MRYTSICILSTLLMLLTGCAVSDDGSSDPSSDSESADQFDGASSDAGVSEDGGIPADQDASSDPVSAIDGGSDAQPEVELPDAAPDGATVEDTPEDLAGSDASLGPDVTADTTEDTALEVNDDPETPFTCAEGLEPCGEDCVDLDIDPNHCGECFDGCDGEQTCVERVCTEQADCRETGCPDEYFCNLGDGLCRLGCANDEDCGDNEECDPLDHTCVCVSDFHLCGVSCVSDDEPAHCGSSCSACPGTVGGQAECISEACDLSCHAGYRLCAGDCRACPTDGVTSTTCAGSRCEASACLSTHRLCDGECAACPDEPGVAATSCDAGGECIIDACQDGYRLCDGSCAACPGDIAGTACVGGSCVELECDGGRPCESGCCEWESSMIIDYYTTYDNELVDVVTDAAGAPHIALAWRDNLLGRVEYAQRNGSGWLLDEVYEADESSGSPTVGLVLAGTVPQVVFDIGGEIYHAIEDDPWDQQILVGEGTGPWPGEPEIVRTSDGRMHIVFELDEEITHYVYASGHYQEPVDIDIAVDVLELDLAAHGTALRMTYQIDTSFSIGYRTWTQAAGWSSVSFIPRSNDGHSHALAVDPDGNPHVTHFSNTYALRYSTRNGATWSTETVDEGHYSDIAVDDAGRPHICFMGPPSGGAGSGLHYGYRVGDAWVIQTLEVGAAVACAIALDGGGSPHIAAVVGTSTSREAWYFH